MPGEDGESKHPLFCLLRKKRATKPPENVDATKQDSIQIPLLQATERDSTLSVSSSEDEENEFRSKDEESGRKMVLFSRRKIASASESLFSKHYESVSDIMKRVRLNSSGDHHNHILL